MNKVKPISTKKKNIEKTIRNTLLAKIHIAKKQMNMEETAYRAMLVRVGDADSCADMDNAQLDAVLDEMETKGFKVSSSKSKKFYKKSNKPIVRKIFALWWELDRLGALAKPGREGLIPYIIKKTISDEKPNGVEVPDFLTTAEANIIIMALQSWIKRTKRSAK